jgi:hypothetical protein
MKLPSFTCDVYPARFTRVIRALKAAAWSTLNARSAEECWESMLCLELEPVPRREGKTNPTRSKGTST